jgi:hypothetical protein
MPDADEFSDSAEGDEEGAARASALRAILIDGLDAKSAEWRIRRQWPRLKDKIPAIMDSAQRTAEKWKPEATRMIDGAMRIITSVEEINKRFLLLMVPGQASCIARISDAHLVTWEDFSRNQMGRFVIVTRVDNKGLVQTSPAAKIWIGDARQRQATKIVFTNKEAKPDQLNLWTGFGVTPEAGKCDLIHQHIREVICARKDVEYKAFINLLAWQVQNIGKSSRIIVDLYSRQQQIGKGVLLEKILAPMFGLHGLFTADSDKVFCRFNDAVRGKAYVAFDEACFAGDRQLADKIKSASGTETTTIEGKGVPVITCPTAVNWYMLTNRPHSAHVEWDDARYWILKVSPHRKGDNAYWADLLREIDEGGISALLHDLLTRDVSNFIPSRDVPIHNDEHKANQRASDPTNPALWLLDCLDNGLWLGSETWHGIYSANKVDSNLVKGCKGALEIESGARMLPAFLESSYRAWAAAQDRYVQAAAMDEFWKLLTGFGFGARRPGGKRIRIIPEAEKLRAKVVEHLGIDDSDNDAEAEEA